MNRDRPRLITVRGGWRVVGIVPEWLQGCVIRDCVSARACRHAARSWYAELQSDQAAEITAGRVLMALRAGAK